jgi:phosphoglycerate kinase
VNDAFGTAHRAHASTVGMVRLVKQVGAGDLLRAELEHLRSVLDAKRPFLCSSAARRCRQARRARGDGETRDVVCVGGAMAYTFLAAQGKPVGTSLVETDRIDDAKRVLAAAKAVEAQLLLPTDHVVAQKLEAGAPSKTVSEIPAG